jgi:hypothetical protein
MLFHDLPESITGWRRVWERYDLGPMINGHPVIVFQAAQLLLGRGERTAAEMALREVLARDPEHLRALRLLAMLVTNRDHGADAEEAAALRARCQAAEAAEAERSSAPPDPVFVSSEEVGS